MKLKIPAGAFHGYLFDCDGTIADSMPGTLFCCSATAKGGARSAGAYRDAQHGHILFAVVSGSTRGSLTASLRGLQLLEKFETLVCAEGYRRGKPDPEAFLIAAPRLGVKPGAC